MSAGRWLVAFALLATVVRPSLEAHPGSTTAVVITTPGEGTVHAALHTDARALVAKLEAAASAPLASDDRSNEELATRVRSLAAVLQERVNLHADERRLSLDVVDVTVDASGQAVVGLGAMVPAGVQTLTWSTNLVFGAYPVSLRRGSGEDVVRWLQGNETSESLLLDGSDPDASVVGPGLWLGFTHIVPYGLDHMLFVLGLVLLGTRKGPLFMQISAFTLAHSVTLGLSLYGVVSLAPHIVEPLIALSVAYVGLENLFASRLTRWRVAVVFAFGLLHGLGFAGIVAGLSLPRADLLATLVSFNVGVELGQLTVVATAWSIMYRVVPVWRVTTRLVLSSAVAVTGLVWTVERVWP